MSPRAFSRDLPRPVVRRCAGGPQLVGGSSGTPLIRDCAESLGSMTLLQSSWLLTMSPTLEIFTASPRSLPGLVLGKGLRLEWQKRARGSAPKCRWPASESLLLLYNWLIERTVPMPVASQLVQASLPNSVPNANRPTCGAVQMCLPHNFSGISATWRCQISSRSVDPETAPSFSDDFSRVPQDEMILRSSCQFSVSVAHQIVATSIALLSTTIRTLL